MGEDLISLMPEYRESANPPHCKCGALKHSWGGTNLWHQYASLIQLAEIIRLERM